MTIGVGGSTAEVELEAMTSMREGIQPITRDERHERIAKAQRLMREQAVDALYLDASTSLFYFTGLRIGSSERLHGAVIPATGELGYVCPAFEEEKMRAMLVLDGAIHTWEEHEDPTALVVDTVRGSGRDFGRLAVDEATPFFTFDGLRKAGNAFEFTNASENYRGVPDDQVAGGAGTHAAREGHYAGSAQGHRPHAPRWHHHHRGRRFHRASTSPARGGWAHELLHRAVR